MKSLRLRLDDPKVGVRWQLSRYLPSPAGTIALVVLAIVGGAIDDSGPRSPSQPHCWSFPATENPGAVQQAVRNFNMLNQYEQA